MHQNQRVEQYLLYGFILKCLHSLDLIKLNIKSIINANLKTAFLALLYLWSLGTASKQ